MSYQAPVSFSYLLIHWNLYSCLYKLHINMDCLYCILKMCNVHLYWLSENICAPAYAYCGLSFVLQCWRLVITVFSSIFGSVIKNMDCTWFYFKQVCSVSLSYFRIEHVYYLRLAIQDFFFSFFLLHVCILITSSTMFTWWNRLLLGAHIWFRKARVSR